MTYFKRTRFSGIAPAVAPRLLADQFGQKAKNIDFESGRLVATTADAYQFTLSNSTRKSIFFYRDTNWLQWNEDVSVVRGPIPGDTTDRLYWTGETYPRMGVRTTIEQGVAPYPTSSYRLGVPSPADQVAAYLDSAPTVVVTTLALVPTATVADDLRPRHQAHGGIYNGLNLATTYPLANRSQGRRAPRR